MPNFERRVSSLPIDPSSPTRFSHPRYGEGYAEEAEFAHEKAEEWAKQRGEWIIEIADAKGDPCEELPHSYPNSHSGVSDKSLRRN